MAAEWAMRLTPEPFRDFLPYTSLSALKVIHTGRVLKRALEIVQHYGSDAARTRAAQTLATSLSTAGLAIEIARSPVAPLNVTALSPEARAEIGASVLGLYFHQLHGRGPWFLDLRPRHFAWNDAQRSLSFFPSGLWYEPDPAFRLRVQALYEGFYRQAPAALATGVELYSWDSRPSPGFSQRIERLLRDHFGPGDASETHFSIAHFRSTFDRIFQETADSNAKLHPELTFLGVGLVGLYLTLEQLQVPLNARRAFEKSAPLRGSTTEAT
ncbi:MAG TPA: hypothetical protein VER04_23180 [Polyangiaceae bacterium]|nr:hypothetical protein [Polyangiaceae bacterium]